jgi:hypothetical protein
MQIVIPQGHIILWGNTRMDAHDRLIQALTDRAMYAHPTTEITVLQTHISWVVLTVPYAYKIKKPVNLGFVDFTTLAVTSTIKWQILRHILAVPSTSFLALSHYAWRRFHPYPGSESASEA